MRSLLVVILLVVINGSSFDKLGVLVHYQTGNDAELKKYVQRLSSCNLIEELNIIVSIKAANDIQSLEQYLKQVKSSFPFNFYPMTKEDKQFKFRIPSQSKAQVYYISSILLTEQSCSQIQDYRTLAQQREKGGLFGPIGELEGVASIQVDLTHKQSQIYFYDKRSSRHYSIVEDIRLLPRHLIEIAHSNISEVAKMSKDMSPYCEEVLLNFVSAHFYPELKPLGINFPTTISQHLQEQAQYSQKTACVRKFINILGYVPVYNQRKSFDKNVWTNPNLNKIIQLKKQQLIIATTSHSRRLAETELTPQQEYYQTILVNILYGVITILLTLISVILYRTYQLEKKMKSLNRKP